MFAPWRSQNPVRKTWVSGYWKIIRRMIGFMQNGSLIIGKIFMEAKEAGLNMQVDGSNFFYRELGRN